MPKIILSIFTFLILTTGVFAENVIETGAKKEQKNMEAKTVLLDSGLRYIDEVVGTGAEATDGKLVTVHYTGWLLGEGDVQGSKFDSSKDSGQPFSFVLAGGQVIKGWDQGVKGMKIGGKRVLLIPSDLGYGTRGAGGVIPPNANLKFEVELLSLR